MKAKAQARRQTTIWTTLVLFLVGVVGAPLAQQREEPILDPELILYDITLSDDTFGNGNTQLEHGEVIEATITLTNAKTRAADDGVRSEKSD